LKTPRRGDPKKNRDQKKAKWHAQQFFEGAGLWNVRAPMKLAKNETRAGSVM
jgi:hypothetical protein